jgi:protein-disulfide isomerase
VPRDRLYAALLADVERERSPAEAIEGIDFAAPRTRVRTEGAPARGGGAAAVTLVVFAQFECPYCRRQQEYLTRAVAMYGDRLRLVHKSFPLNATPGARLSAEAAMCAHLQGKFWIYHDHLYQNSRALGREALIRYARDLGLDAVRFQADLDGGRCAAPVDSDVAEGSAVGVTGTPTMFVNGVRVVGVLRSYAELSRIIDEELRPGILRRLSDPDDVK